MQEFVRKCWLFGGVLFAFAFSAALRAEEEDPQLQGVWQRVYNSCGTRIPHSESELFSWSEGIANLREMALVIDGEQFAAFISPSRACLDLSLKTETGKDCRVGVNQGVWKRLDEGLLMNQWQGMHFLANEPVGFRMHWGGGWFGDTYFYRIENGILMIVQKGVCEEGFWSIYFVRAAVS